MQRHVEMAAEIKNLDTDLQMLVYENYNKFISATDTIKRYLSLRFYRGIGKLYSIRSSHC